LTFVSGWRRGNGGGKYEPEKPTWQKDKEAEQENARGGGWGMLGMSQGQWRVNPSPKTNQMHFGGLGVESFANALQSGIWELLSFTGCISRTRF